MKWKLGLSGSLLGLGQASGVQRLREPPIAKATLTAEYGDFPKQGSQSTDHPILELRLRDESVGELPRM